MDLHSAIDDAISQPKPLEGLSNPLGLSKNAQKRAAKAARLQEHKLERRAREKEARKHRRRKRATATANGEVDESASGKRRKTNAGGETEIFYARVVVDLGFDELMSDKEIASLTSQLAYTYSANRHAARAFSALVFTSLNGRTKQRLEAMNDASFRRWSRTEWWEQGYERLWNEPQSHNEDMSMGDGRKSIIYLTADSSEELFELNEGETYIIGGICDHNRYKNLCLNKAIGSQIRHARLPIGRYIALATRKVLTVNQVFEILLKWVESRDWEDAFWAVIPKRKFQSGLMRDQSGGGELYEASEQENDGDYVGSTEVVHVEMETGPLGVAHSEN